MVAIPSAGENSADTDNRGDHYITSDSIVFAFSGTGSRHIGTGVPCQDSCIARLTDGGIFICTADGHGGEDYIRSGEGSRLCCEAAYECMTDNTLLAALGEAGGVRQAERLIAQLKKSIICRWNEAIAGHYSKNPLTEDEISGVPERAATHYRAGEYIERMYGTTLLAALMTGEYCLMLQLGDGKCVVLRDGEYISPMPDDEKCVYNQTTSMCDSRAFAEMRHCFFAPLDDIPEEMSDMSSGMPEDGGESENGGAETGRYYRYIPEAIFLCTDGISNSFSDDEGLYNFYYMVTENLCETYEGLAKEKKYLPARTSPPAQPGIDMDAEMRELREFISIISKKGSGDDVSLASIIHVR